MGKLGKGLAGEVMGQQGQGGCDGLWGTQAPLPCLWLLPACFSCHQALENSPTPLP